MKHPDNRNGKMSDAAGFRLAPSPVPHPVPSVNGHDWTNSPSGGVATTCMNCGGWAGKVANSPCPSPVQGVEEHPCGDYPAPCNCDDPETHGGH